MENRLKHAVVILLALCAAMLLLARPHSSPPRKPLPENREWYLVVKAFNQASTAYTEPAGSPLTASARPYSIGSVAVHPRVPGGSQVEPIIPFGTIIYLDNPKKITIQGQEFNAFTVLDTGDANWALWPDSPYWVDLYFGTSNYWNNKAASEYGMKRIDYHWYEPIR